MHSIVSREWDRGFTSETCAAEPSQLVQRFNHGHETGVLPGSFFVLEVIVALAKRLEKPVSWHFRATETVARYPISFHGIYHSTKESCDFYIINSLRCELPRLTSA